MEPASILQSVIDVLFDRASTSLVTRIGVLFGDKEEIKKMSKALLRIKALVKDTEHRRAKDQRVKVWLDELKMVAYDVEDMIEEFQYEDLKLQLEGTPSEGILNQVSSTFSLDDISRKSEIANKIGNMRVRIDDIALQGNWFSLGEFSGMWHQQDEMSELRETSSLVPDRFNMFGRDDDVEAVIKLLMAANGENVAVVPIVGMGGIGKTTLAQHLYNNEDVNSHFEVKIWVYVSMNFDLKNLTREILQRTGEDYSSISMSLDFLQIRLMEKLKQKKFLIVLDDVWLDSQNEWEHFGAPFTVGEQGSKLLVTTRSEKVSQMMSLTEPYVLKGLSEDAVWSLFAERAFRNINPEEHLMVLVAIGKKFIAKCMGLPLAARSLGDILHFKQEYGEWIQENEIFAHARNVIMQNLQLSYHYLPSNLKKCFEYCSMFPKQYKFDKDNLVLQWMSVNLLEATGLKPMEDIGRAFFEDLRLRSFFCSNGPSTCSMHEFIHDLSREISAGECVNMNEGGSLLSISEKARHVSLVYKNPTDIKFSNRCTSLRSLVFLPQPVGMPKIPIEEAALTDLFTKLPHLRMLDLNSSGIMNLPEAIGNLKYLRYLNLSHTELKALPESVTSLYRLQTLKLIGTEVVELPKGITKLVNLRNLQLNKQIVSNCTPPGLGKLVNLQALESIVVDEESGQGIRELKDMNCLRGSLKIVKLESVVDAEEAKLGELINKKRLTELSLEWKKDNSMPDEVASEVLNCLQPHTNLQVLYITGYNGVRFPSWIHDSGSNLVEVTLSNCKCCDVLPSLGQLPFLKILTIGDMDGIKKVGREFCGDIKISFPALKELYIRNMLSLEVWLDVVEGDYPKLSILSIWNCPKLRVLPQILPALVHLSLMKCNGLELQSLHFYSASLQHLEFRSFLEIKSLPDDLFQPLTSLKKLTIVRFEQITSLAENGLENLTSLHCLNITGCKNLTSFPERLRNLCSLQSLQIYECESLLSFPDECLPTSLTELTLVDCKNLYCLPKGLQNLTSLKMLTIIGCPQLKFLPEDMPTTLQELHIKLS